MSLKEGTMPEMAVGTLLGLLALIAVGLWTLKGVSND